MKYRTLDSNDDFTFGSGSTFLEDNPAAVAQAVKTRMSLAVGEWFLDTTEGLDGSKILGVRTQSSRDLEIQQRILGTPGVSSIQSYSSDMNIRGFTVTVTLDTLYGSVTITGDY